MANFMGKNGFQWFVGVVEDRQDPKHLGRIRVRALGYHTENLTDLPTADLPWAHPMNPITSATVSGTWVVGFFQDGADAQQPVIMGTLPGVPSSLPDTGSNKGFQDHTNANYPKYKETDVNRLAVNEKSGLLELNPHSTLTLRRADRDIFVGQADWTQTELRINQGLTVTLPVDDGKSFSEPSVPYGAVYPYNHVVETESGHIRELDDTPGAERIHERHASGSG